MVNCRASVVMAMAIHHVPAGRAIGAHASTVTSGKIMCHCRSRQPQSAQVLEQEVSAIVQMLCSSDLMIAVDCVEHQCCQRLDSGLAQQP